MSLLALSRERGERRDERSESPGAAAPRDEERRARAAKKRRDVLEATLRLLAREGPRGVTHRAVAAEAATSLRATTYYFASREELLGEALRHYADEAMRRFDVIGAPLDAAAAPPVALVAELLAATVLSDVVDERVGLVAEYELVLEASRNPALEPVYAAFQARLEGLLTGYAAALGAPEPALEARLVLATLRGLELEALARPSQRPSGSELAAVFRALLEALAARRGRPRTGRAG